MKLKAFSIRDQKAEIFNTPYFNKTMGEAERNFAQAVNDSKTMLNKYPEDFDLYYLGEYDDQKGTVAWEETPKHIAKAVSFVQSPQPIDSQK
jgi:hypothetical protein